MSHKLLYREWGALSVVIGLCFLVIPSCWCYPSHETGQKSIEKEKPHSFSYIRLEGAIGKKGLVRISKGRSLESILKYADLLPEADLSKLNLQGSPRSKKIYVPFKSIK